MKEDSHSGHELADDPFQFPGHLKRSAEYQQAIHQAKKHREQVLSYSDSRRLLDSEDLGIVVSVRDYYNSVRKEKPDKSKPKTIVALLRMLEENEFHYRTRVSVEEDETGNPLTRKFIQLDCTEGGKGTRDTGAEGTGAQGTGAQGTGS